MSTTIKIASKGYTLNINTYDGDIDYIDEFRDEKFTVQTIEEAKAWKKFLEMSNYPRDYNEIEGFLKTNSDVFIQYLKIPECIHDSIDRLLDMTVGLAEDRYVNYIDVTYSAEDIFLEKIYL